MKGKLGPPREDSFTAFVLDQLQGLGGVEARRMFGGKGLYWKDQIFGLIDEGRVYFRVSEITVARYQAAGAKPFEPWPGHVMKGYYELPTNIVEDPDEAAAWAREAWSLPRNKRKVKASSGTKARASGAPKSKGVKTTPRKRSAR